MTYQRAIGGLALAVGMAVAGLASAGPAAASPTCEVRSEAHIAKYGGLTKDSADHVARGELPTCDPNPPKASEPAPMREHEEKSRYCKKRWFC